MSQAYINQNQKLEFLQSGFHQYLLINLDTQDHLGGNMPIDFVNLTIKLEDIGGGEGNTAWGINKKINLINDKYDNVLFTPASDFESIYAYEYYKGVYYIKAKPFEEVVAMHILPKKIHASDKVLRFKDEDADYNKLINSNYCMDPDKINIYFKSIDLNNDNAEEKRSINNAPYPKFHKFGSGDIKKLYQKHRDTQWESEDYVDSYGEYNFDISSWAKKIMNVQINAGYKYNNSSPITQTSNNPYAIHYTGIKDTTNNQIEDRAVLMDANYDNVATKTNNIQQMEFYKDNGDKKLRFPTTLNIFKEGFNNQHTNSPKTFHKIIKYFNDILYTEEDGNFVIENWDDPSI